MIVDVNSHPAAVEIYTLLRRVRQSYVVRRVVFAIVVMWAVFTVVFVLLYVLPGDPARVIAGGGGLEATPQQLAQIRAQYGLDRPIIVQYFSALGGIVTLHLGDSYVFKRPVTDLLASNFASTASLAAFALVVSVVVGLLIGGFAAYTRSRPLGALLDSLPPVGVALPTFWVGLVLMQLFSFALGWFPASGEGGFASLVLPGITMSIPSAALIAQVFARSLRVATNEPFVAIARAKGVSRGRVFMAHIARNALLPTVTGWPVNP